MKTNRHWFPHYCNPDNYLPQIHKSKELFRRPPLYFPDFVGKALGFLQSETAAKMGFQYDPRKLLPCKWKCADESLFQTDITLYAYTGFYPFDKGAIGGFLNVGSLGAAVNHGQINLDVGGSHVGYRPGAQGGSFGYVWRPQQECMSTDCGYLMSLVMPFDSVYKEAMDSILLFSPDGERVILSIPNEFIQPNWSTHPVKLLIDLETVAAEPVEDDPKKPYTHTPINRSLFYVQPDFLKDMNTDKIRIRSAAAPTPIGHHLQAGHFGIFDERVELDENGLPRERLLLYMNEIVSALDAPSILKACIINTSLEHTRLIDAVRSPGFKPYSFASFSGVFIDLYDETTNSYYNLFQPLGLSLKPKGTRYQVDVIQDEIYDHFKTVKSVSPKVDLAGTGLGVGGERLVERFTYRPGYYEESDENED